MQENLLVLISSNGPISHGTSNPRLAKVDVDYADPLLMKHGQTFMGTKQLAVRLCGSETIAQ